MVNITHKSSTLRKAIATAVVQTSSAETIDAVVQKKVPKGDVFEFSRAAGLLAIKKTSDVIPDCHPLPVEFASISFNVQELSIEISVEVHTIYKTGVEVEAMHGAAVTALVIYDMLKPIDKSVEIGNIRLQQKTGGKTDSPHPLQQSLKCAVIVCSDTISHGDKQDTSGKAIIQRLATHGIECNHYDIIPDDVQIIQTTARSLVKEEYDMIFFTGGTGVSPRDVTPDALAVLIDKPIPGIMEAARQYGQQRTPRAMFSRGVSGFIQNTLVLTLPGSKAGAEETMSAIFPHVLHLFEVRAGVRHS